MPRIAVTVQIHGAPEALQKLQGLNRSMQKRILRKGVRAASQVCAKEKSVVPVGETQLLRKSIGWRLAKQKAGVPKALGIVGPRRRKFRRWIHGKGIVNPTKYAHLPDAGTAPHRIQGRDVRGIKAPTSVGIRPLNRLAFKAGGRSVVVPAVNHPGSRPQRFIQAIQNRSRARAQATFNNKVASEVIIQATKARPSEVDDGT